MLLASTGWAFVALCAIQEDPQTAVRAAVKKLAETGNYTWSLRAAAQDVILDLRRGAKPLVKIIAGVEGKFDKGGIVQLKQDDLANRAGRLALLKGGKVILETDKGWKRATDLDSKADAYARFFAGVLEWYPPPASDVIALLKQTTELKSISPGEFEGKLTAEGALACLERTVKGGGHTDPLKVTYPQGTLRLSIKDGTLVQYEFSVQGGVELNEAEIQLGRTVTVTIKDAGKTTIDMPDEARKLLE